MQDQDRVKSKRSKTENWNWVHCRNRGPDGFRQRLPPGYHKQALQKDPQSWASSWTLSPCAQSLTKPLSIPLQGWMSCTIFQLYRCQKNICLRTPEIQTQFYFIYFASRATSELQWLPAVLGEVLQGRVLKVKHGLCLNTCTPTCATDPSDEVPTYHLQDF